MKNVVISGATKGLGRAIAEIFAENGYNIAVCARTKSDLAAMKKDFSKKYPNIQLLAKQADMRKPKDCVAFGEFIKKNWTHIAVLINNAGVFLPGTMSEEAEGTLEKLIETNLYSAYHLTRNLLPTMVAQGQGHIFNMCSIASIVAYPSGGSYSISKFALLGFSKVLREEMKPKGIKVTAILPGATWSDAWSGVQLPQDRLMQASDIAKTIWGAYNLSDVAVIEELIIRPQLGDL
jgi:short-subunit dehydrogenase